MVNNTTYRFISVYKVCVILYQVATMNFLNLNFLIFLIILLVSCQSIENKSQKLIKKENEKLSKFLQQPESELKIVMGEPNQINYDDKGSTFFIYTKKKYNITCERIFELDRNKMVIGFTSKGCF